MAANAALKKVNHRIKDFEQIVHQNKLPDTKGALLPKMSPTKEKAAQKKQLDQFCKPRILYPRNPRNRLFSHLQMKKQKVDENPPIYQKYVAPTGPAPKATPADPWEPELGVPWKPLQSAPTKPQPTGWLDLKTQDYVPQKEFVSRSVWGRSPSPPPTSRNMDIGSSSDCVDMVDEVDSQPQTWQTSNWWRRHSSSVLV